MPFALFREPSLEELPALQDALASLLDGLGRRLSGLAASPLRLALACLGQLSNGFCRWCSVLCPETGRSLASPGVVEFLPELSETKPLEILGI